MTDDGLDEDLLTEKIPSRYSQYLEEDNFEKFSHRHKEWE